MTLPAKTIPELTAYASPLAGNELVEISILGASRRITARDFVLPIDSLITVSGMGGSLPASRQLTAGVGITFVDGGAGSTLQINATGAVAGPANPTAQVGLVAVNGVAITYMRSDAAPPLDQGIAPVWTAQHTFSLAGTLAAPTVYLTSARPILGLDETDAAADNRRWTIEAQAEQLVFRTVNDAGAASAAFITVDRTGTVVDSVALASTAFTWNASQVLTQSNAFANPTALVGLAAVNGAATTAMRSDAAPPLDQAIAPTWTAQHQFSLSGATNAAIIASSSQPQVDWNETDGAANNRRWRIEVNGEQMLFRVVNDANSAAVSWAVIDRTANVVDSIAWTSTALTWNGSPLLSAATAFANPTASVGLAAVNGAATTAMRSDAAPALSQSIAPTWTGQHTFSNAVTLFTNNSPLIRMTDADGSADSKTWQWDLSVANQLSLTTVTDAIGAGVSVFTVLRSGTAVTSTTYPSNVSLAKAFASGSLSGYPLLLSSTQPAIALSETDGAADNRLWDIVANNETLTFRVVNDAVSVANNWMTVDRTGTTVDNVTFPSPVILTSTAGSAGMALVISNGAPGIGMNESDAAANNRFWFMQPSGETLQFGIANDSFSVFSNWMTVDRTGTTLDHVNFPLTSRGTFLVGASAPLTASAYIIHVAGNTEGAAILQVTTATIQPLECWNSATSGDNLFLSFNTEAGRTQRGYIDFNRAGVATRYNTTSDRRLKKNISPSSEASNLIDQLQVVSFDWIETESHSRYSFVAQDLYRIFPDAVSKGDDREVLTEEGRVWGVDPSKLVPLLTKEIQSLRARVGALEKKSKLN